MKLRWLFIDIGGPILDDGPLFDYLTAALRGILSAQGHPVGGEVYRSNDKGLTWRRTHESSLYHVFGPYGWKFADIHVSPSDENDLFIMGTRMYHSTDGGRTFKRISERIVRFHDHKTAGMHLDHHELWIDRQVDARLHQEGFK